MSLHEMTFIGIAAIVTLLLPCEDPKLVPVMMNPTCGGPEVKDKLLICGVTVKEAPLLAVPPTVTMTGPVTAPLGT